MTSSFSLLKSFNEVLDETISFVGHVFFKASPEKTTEYFLLLGRHSVIFMKKDIKNVKTKIEYSSLERIILDMHDNTIIQFHFNEKRPENIPPIMNLFTQARRTLCNHLKIAYNTDYMFREDEVGQLPLFKGKTDLTVRKFAKSLFQKVPLSITNPPNILNEQGCNQVIFDHNRYRFFAPSSFKKTEQEGVYKGNESWKNYEIQVQISKEVPFDYLDQMGEKSDLQSYCESFMRGYLGQKDYFVIKSDLYVKRYNLIIDEAEWQGWQIHARDLSRDYLFIMLRRSFIPPLLDTFTDFGVIIRGKEQKYIENEPDFLETRKTWELCQLIVNSLHPVQRNVSVFKAFVQLRADALLLSEKALQFYKEHQGIQSKRFPFQNFFYKKYAWWYTYRLLEKLRSPDTQEEVDYLLKKINSMKIEEFEDVRDEFAKESLEFIRRKFYVEQKCKGENKEYGERQWQFKIAKYLAYCIDGGLGIKFSLSDVLDYEKSINDHQNRSDISMELIQMLFMVPQDDLKQPSFKDDFPSMVSQMLKEKQRYIINKRVLIVLLEQRYIENQLLRSNKPFLYPQFLNYLVENFNDFEINCAICRHIIYSQMQIKAKGSDKLDQKKKQALEELVEMLIRLYDSDNYKLATLAAVALTNLCTNDKVMKQKFMKNKGDKVILKQALSKDQHLLANTLKLTIYLIKIPQYIDYFKHFFSKKFLQLLLINKKTFQIPGTVWSNEILMNVFSLLIQLLNEDYKLLYFLDLEINQIVTDLINLFTYVLEDKRQQFEDQAQTFLLRILWLLRGMIGAEQQKNSQEEELENENQISLQIIASGQHKLIKQLIKGFKENLYSPDVINEGLYMILILMDIDQESVEYILISLGAKGILKKYEEVDTNQERIAQKALTIVSKVKNTL